MLIRANTDGTYSANWTPGAVGLYTIHVTIDGIEIGKQMGVNPHNTIRDIFRFLLTKFLSFRVWQCGPVFFKCCTVNGHVLQMLV